jgi:hypothetical protein
MRKLILTTTLVGTLGALPAPRPADAATAEDCLLEAYYSCKADFPSSNSERLIAIRGWCYLIRWGLCELF